MGSGWCCSCQEHCPRASSSLPALLPSQDAASLLCPLFPAYSLSGWCSKHLETKAMSRAGELMSLAAELRHCRVHGLVYKPLFSLSQTEVQKQQV